MNSKDIIVYYTYTISLTLSTVISPGESGLALSQRPCVMSFVSYSWLSSVPSSLQNTKSYLILNSQHQTTSCLVLNLIYVIVFNDNDVIYDIVGRNIKVGIIKCWENIKNLKLNVCKVS